MTTLREAAQQDANLIHYGRHTKKPKTHSALFEDCTNPRCVERRELLAAVPDTDAGLRSALAAADELAAAWAAGVWREAADYSAIEGPYERWLTARAALQPIQGEPEPPE